MQTVKTGVEGCDVWFRVLGLRIEDLMELRGMRSRV
jgi:hypothetical protein